MQPGPKVVALGSPKPQGYCPRAANLQNFSFYSGEVHHLEGSCFALFCRVHSYLVTFNQASSPRVPSFRQWPRTTPRPTFAKQKRSRKFVQPEVSSSHFESAKSWFFGTYFSLFFLHLTHVFSGSLCTLFPQQGLCGKTVCDEASHNGYNEPSIV